MSCCLKTLGNGSVELLYDDAQLPLYDQLGTIQQVERASQINPGPVISRRPTWVIHWTPGSRFATLFGPVTATREDGTPFRAKFEAGNCEVALLKKCYFKV